MELQRGVGAPAYSPPDENSRRLIDHEPGLVGSNDGNRFYSVFGMGGGESNNQRPFLTDDEVNGLVHTPIEVAVPLEPLEHNKASKRNKGRSRKVKGELSPHQKRALVFKRPGKSRENQAIAKIAADMQGKTPPKQMITRSKAKEQNTNVKLLRIEI